MLYQLSYFRNIYYLTFGKTFRNLYSLSLPRLEVSIPLGQGYALPTELFPQYILSQKTTGHACRYFCRSGIQNRNPSAKISRFFEIWKFYSSKFYRFCNFCEEFFVCLIKMVEKFTIHIQYCRYISLVKDWHHDLRPGEKAAGNMTR